MTDQIVTRMDLPIEAIRAYCQRWKIVELSLFGSVLRDDFDDESDVDILVQFDEDTHHTLFDLTTMTDELESLFGRKVDLLTRKGVEESPNYIRRRSILGSVQVIYAA